MGSTRSKVRGARDRRPGLECLESRQLLSVGGAAPGVGGTFLNGDGSVNYDQVIGASAARKSYGVDGTGSNVAVIDTGVDYKNPILGGGSVGAGHKVVTGVDFTGGATGILPVWQHGTGVAGLLAGNGAGYQGVAPGAGIVALRVFGDNNQGSFDDIARALEWVAQHHAEAHITAVNLSVADGGNYQTNIFGGDGGAGQRITGDIQALAALDIPVVVAVGNSFNGKDQGEGFAAIVPGAIGVTATDETRVTAASPADRLASNAQRLGAGQAGAPATLLAAPGVGITAPSGDGGTGIEDGTSYAAPQVTGTIVLLQQMFQAAYNRSPTLPEINTLLRDGGVTVHDDVTGIDVKRLDAANSLKILHDQIHPPGATGPVSPGAKAEVTVNGAAPGTDPSPRLASKPARLPASSKGPANPLRARAAAGSKGDLGVSQPSGAASRVAGHGSAKRASTASARLRP